MHCMHLRKWCHTIIFFFFLLLLVWFIVFSCNCIHSRAPYVLDEGMCFLSSVFTSLSLLVSLILSLHEGWGALVCQSACGMHYFIWKKAVISPNTVKQGQSPGSTLPVLIGQCYWKHCWRRAHWHSMHSFIMCSQKDGGGDERQGEKIQLRLNLFMLCCRVCVWLLF